MVTCLGGQMRNALLNSLRQMTYLKTYLFAFETCVETSNVTSKAHNLVSAAYMSSAVEHLKTCWVID